MLSMRHLSCIVLGLCGLSPIAAQKPSLGKRLDNYLYRCAAHGWSGSVLVARKGVFHVKGGYGLADRKAVRKNTANTLFEIASTTKQFTAAAILKLEEQGKLSTSDLITKFLPGVPENCREFTIYHLLTHSSGMPRRAVGGTGENLEAAVKAYLAKGLVRKPDTLFEYWNGGYALLAGIVAKASGTSYTEYCRKHLFEPAGLKNTGFTGDQNLPAPEAVGYNGSRRERSALEHPYGSYGWQYRGMGGAVSTVNDLYRWDRALLGDKILSKNSRKKLLKPHLGNYACGWYIVNKGRLKITHGGDVRGFHTQYVRFPEEDATIIVTSNVDGVPLWTIASNIESMLFDTELRYPVPPPIAVLKANDMAAVLGTYEVSAADRVGVRGRGSGIRVGGVGRTIVPMLDDSRFSRVKKRSFPKEEDLAVRVIQGLAKGEVDLLRETMHKRIPGRWPDDVKNSLWPQQTQELGALESVRVVDAELTRYNRVGILLELIHAKGRGHTRIEFANGVLMILNLNGPEFAVTLDLVPTAKDQFTRFNWSQKPAITLTIERGQGGRVVAILLRSVRGEETRAAKVK